MTEPLPQLASSLFPIPLIVEACDDDVMWKVCEDFYSEDPILGRIDVPAGTLTDFGSIPKVFHSIISPTSRYRKPFVIHDRNYTVQKCTQKEADDCLMRGMKDRDALHNQLSPWWKRKFGLERATIYSALRLCGWFVWNQHKKELKNQPS